MVMINVLRPFLCTSSHAEIRTQVVVICGPTRCQLNPIRPWRRRDDDYDRDNDNKSNKYNNNNNNSNNNIFIFFINHRFG